MTQPADTRARDSAGRFLARPAMIPAMSAGLAQALLDASAETWRVNAATTLAERLASAIEFGDRVADLLAHRNGNGAGS